MLAFLAPWLMQVVLPVQPPPPLPPIPLEQKLESIGRPSSPLNSDVLNTRVQGWSLLNSDTLKQVSKQRIFRILQIGDSHTAGDFFTNYYRNRLQSSFGDGGIGWILPGAIRGQRSARYSVLSEGRWLLQYPHGSRRNVITPFGGYINIGSKGSVLRVKPRLISKGSSSIRIGAYVRSLNGKESVVQFGSELYPNKEFNVGPEWQYISRDIPVTPVLFSQQLKFKILSGSVAIAGLSHESLQGVVVDQIGRNGAELRWMNQWSTDNWSRLFRERPVDIVVLAFGTNESVDRVSTQSYSQVIDAVVGKLQLASPGLPIVLISTPAFAKGSRSSCLSYRPLSINQILQAQVLATRRQSGVRTWNWAQAMGGLCSVSSWAQQGLMGSDWIHFSRKGYYKSAELFNQWLLQQGAVDDGLN